MGENTEKNEEFFRLVSSVSGGGFWSTPLGRLAVKPAEWLIGFSGVDAVYRKALSAVGPQGGTREIFAALLDLLGVRFEVAPSDLARVPKTRPLIVVCNHPFGMLDGICVTKMLMDLRPDVKTMGSFLLGHFSRLNDNFVYVNPFGGDEARNYNLSAIRESMDWVRKGGVLTVFPAGVVAHLVAGRRAVVEPPWNERIARLIRRTGAQVLPVHIEGRNSALFQASGLLHPQLRTALLVREFLNKKGLCVPIRVGNPVPAAKLEPFDDAKMMTYLRVRTCVMAKRPADRVPSADVPPAARAVKCRREEPVVEAEHPALIASEVAALPPAQLLVESGEFQVLWAEAGQSPKLLREIGRLRELTFRAVGEGTGLAIDLDRFDPYYLHLFVWNREKQELVGAYRLGMTDRIMARHGGKQGLYTNTLFRYRMRLLESISPAIELGRSFVRAEYQRSYGSLMLLWKGIGQFIVRNPDYKNLFGPVSINSRYQTFSRQLMMEFLKANSSFEDLAKLVKAKVPMKDKPIPEWEKSETLSCISTLEDLSDLVAEIETEQQEIPILLKQYLKLGGKLLGFNIDPDFNDVLDGLIYVDLTRTDPRILERYMGKEGVKSFLDYQRMKESVSGGSLPSASAQ